MTMTRRDITCRRVRINSLGYDSAGNYWGVGHPPIYWFACVDDRTGAEISEIYRAPSRAAAMIKGITEFKLPVASSRK